jgi:hypothetical protein
MPQFPFWNIIMEGGEKRRAQGLRLKNDFILFCLEPQALRLKPIFD